MERLLAIPEVNEKYHKLLRELAEKVFAKDRLLADIEAIQKATKEPLAKEKKAASDARKRRPPSGRRAPQHRSRPT